MISVKKLVALSTVLMLVGWAAGTSIAGVAEAAKSNHAKIHKTEHPMIQTVYGTVSAVNPDTKTVEVTVPEGRTEHLVVGATVTDQTVIKEGKARKNWAN